MVLELREKFIVQYIHYADVRIKLRKHKVQVAFNFKTAGCAVCRSVIISTGHYFSAGDCRSRPSNDMLRYSASEPVYRGRRKEGRRTR